MKASRKKTSKTPLSSSRTYVVAPLALLLGLGFLGYWNSFDVPLVFDDLVSIQANAGVRFGDYLNPSIFFRGLLYITFTLNYLVSGEDVWGYHLINLLLHLANGVLVYFIALRIFEKSGVQHALRTSAFAAAAFFLLHPVQTQSVTYVSSRSELLSTLFYAGAFLLFISVRRERIGFLFSLIIGALFILGIGAKETVISLPAVLVLYDFLFLSNSTPREMLARWRFYATFILGAILVGYRLVTSVLVGSIGGDLQGHLSSWHYLLTQTRVLVRYVWITFIPTGLTVDYDFRPSTSLADPAVIASVLFLLGLVVLGWRLRRTRPVFAFSIFWFFLTLAPTSSVVPLLDVIFEHRLYLPMVGICLSLPLLVSAALSAIPTQSGFRPKPVHAYVLLVALALLGTVLRNEVWRDEVGLWRDTVTKSPNKVRPYALLTLAHFKRGDYEKALEVTREGIRNVPDQKKLFYDQLGHMYLRLNRFQEAVGVFEEAMTAADKPAEVAVAANNLGLSYLYMWNDLQQKRSQLAPEVFEQEKQRILGQAEQAFARSTEASLLFWAFDSYINVVHARGLRTEEVRKELLEKVNGEDAFTALYGLAKLHFLDGEVTGTQEPYRQAIRYFEEAEKLDRSQKTVFFNYAYALNKVGETDLAIEKYLQAIRLDPLFLAANTNVALAYMTKKNFPAAIESFSKVFRLDPKNLFAHLNIAKIYIQLGQMDLARQHLSAALEVSPSNAEAVTLLKMASSGS